MARKSLILVTGAAGFIGHHTVVELLRQGHHVVGIDNFNDYYDKRLKRYRMGLIKHAKNFKFYTIDIENAKQLNTALQSYKFDAVINLAARAGVRKSIESPQLYCSTNVQGALNMLEFCKTRGIKKFVIASTSSLYAGQKMPFKEITPVDQPFSPYAATKKAAEVLSFVYHHLHGLDVTVLRYFTVYGPMGRPDMSYFKFINLMDKQKKIEIFGDGSQSRDFTYIEDIARGPVLALKRVGFEIINLGSDKPYTLSTMIAYIEAAMGCKSKKAHKQFLAVDMKATWADISKAKKLLGWEPKISLQQGINRTVAWHKQERFFIQRLKES